MKEEDEGVEALLDISDVYMDAHLYAQAKPFLQKAYQKDYDKNRNTSVINR